MTGDGLVELTEMLEQTNADLVEATAQRVVELLAPHLALLTAPATGASPAIGRQLTVADVAARLGRSADWVRDHRAELGLLPAEGRRPRLLFDPEAVAVWATARSTGDASQPARSSAATGNAPIPIRRRSGRRRAGVTQPGSVLAVRGREERRRDAA